MWLPFVPVMPGVFWKADSWEKAKSRLRSAIDGMRDQPCSASSNAFLVWLCKPPRAPSHEPSVPIILGVIGNSQVNEGDCEKLCRAIASIAREFCTAFPDSPIELLANPGDPAETFALEVAKELRTHKLNIAIRHPLAIARSHPQRYIAQHSNALIALWDGATVAGGTGEHVRFKLTGSRPSGYPPGPALGSAADTGPVYVVKTPPMGAGGGDPSAGEITVFVPSTPLTGQELAARPRLQFSWELVRAAPGPTAGAAPTAHGGVHKEWGQFRETCRAIDRFNRDSMNYARVEKPDDIENALGGSRLPTEAKDAIGHISRVRKRAATISRKLEEYRTNVLGSIFFLVFFSALGFHLYAHMTDQDEAHAPIFMFFALGMVVLWAAVPFIVGMLRMQPRRLDCRALAEAFRVRCWWAMAGLSTSVADSYLNQLRGEMAWARRALYSLTPPPDMWPAWFSTLSVQEQVEQLRAVKDAWVQEQARYFDKSRDRDEKSANKFRSGGIFLVFVGWLIGFVLLFPMNLRRNHPAADAPAAAASERMTDRYDAWHPHTFLLIASGLSVLAGGLLVAYRERQAFEETAKQFDRMAAVFRHGLHELTKCLNRSPATPAVVKDMQDIFEQLGREALTENAQWLILRRSRPFEPPLG